MDKQRAQQLIDDGLSDEYKKFRDADDWSKIRLHGPLDQRVLGNFDLRNCEIIEAVFGDSNSVPFAPNQTFRSCDFEGCLIAFPSDQVEFIQCRFKNCNIREFKQARFALCEFADSQFSPQFHMEFLDCIFRQPLFATGRFNLSGGSITTPRFPNEVVGSQFSSVVFKNAELGSVRFDSCNFVAANLLDVTVDSNTVFHRCRVSHCKIDRFTLDCLKENGGLTVGELRVMDIQDGIATLRNSFSGIFQWIHIFSLVAFVAPYAWFLLRIWGKAKFNLTETQETATVFQALYRYALSGGVSWDQNWAISWKAAAILATALVYNVARFLLLVKTKKLELERDSRGVPPLFSLKQGFWKWLYDLTKFTYYLYLIVVILNVSHFLQKEIVVN